jgi:hypothetical protein
VIDEPTRSSAGVVPSDAAFTLRRMELIELDLGEVVWMLDLPCWEDENGRVRPLDVVSGRHLELTEQADLSEPIDVVWQEDRYVVVDGLHRVLRAARLRQRTVLARAA